MLQSLVFLFLDPHPLRQPIDILKHHALDHALLHSLHFHLNSNVLLLIMRPLNTGEGASRQFRHCPGFVEMAMNHHLVSDPDGQVTEHEKFCFAINVDVHLAQCRS